MLFTLLQKIVKCKKKEMMLERHICPVFSLLWADAEVIGGQLWACFEHLCSDASQYLTVFE